MPWSHPKTILKPIFNEENRGNKKGPCGPFRFSSEITLLPQELFAAPYFCKKQEAKYFELAEETANSHLIQEMSALAKELGVVIPVSYFEKAGNTFFNSLVMIDADGTVLDNYRKSHIPDGPGYSEKYYFSPGDTGFKVWQTKFGKFGAGICWDQWFPELARSLALHG
ncbi:carbon-nitrogen hydrolase family protein, partial [Vibrio parahaemolyticus AQ3810]